MPNHASAWWLMFFLTHTDVAIHETTRPGQASGQALPKNSWYPRDTTANASCIKQKMMKALSIWCCKHGLQHCSYKPDISKFHEDKA